MVKTRFLNAKVFDSKHPALKLFCGSALLPLIGDRNFASRTSEKECITYNRYSSKPKSMSAIGSNAKGFCKASRSRRK